MISKKHLSVTVSLLFLILLFNTQSFSQQERETNRKSLPTVESIKEIIASIKNYYVNSTVYKIINIRTGEEIKDFTTVNPDAGNDTRANDFTDWAYTNGVLYSAFVCATEVTGDSSFIKYAINKHESYAKN